MPQVVSIGDCPIAFAPAASGSLSFIDDYQRTLAGAELNVCIGCARLNISSGLISCVSDDPFGRFVLHRLRGEGVDTSHIAAEARPSPLLFKERLPGGDFRVYYHRHDCAGGKTACTSGMEKYVRAAKVFLYTGIFPALSEVNVRTLERLLSAAKRAKTLCVFDPNIRMKLLHTPARARKLLRPLAAQADIVMLGEEEADMLYGALGGKLYDKLGADGVRHVVVKRGANGAVAFVGGREYEIPAHPVQVVDACGAGDAFNAGYISALLRRRPVRECLRFAAVCASYVVASASDNGALPFWEDIKPQTDKAPR